MKKKEAKKHHFVKKPFYPGGTAAMREFIRKNLRYPQDALDNQIEGTVQVQYHIDNDGKVIKTKVIQPLGYGCDEEAERLTKMLRFEIGKNYRKHYFIRKVNIHFRLQKKPLESTNYQYQYKTSEEKNERPRPTKANSYSYTISWDS